MTKKITYLIIFLLILLSVIFYFSKYKLSTLSTDKKLSEENKLAIELPDRQELLEIIQGSTFGELMNKSGISPVLSNEIYKAALDKYDLAKIKVGYFLELNFNKDSNEFKQLTYKIDTENEIVINYKNNLNENTSSTNKNASSTNELTNSIEADIIPINYDIKIVTKKAAIETSMYEAALKNNIDERAIIALADTFQWTIDFATDPRVSDTFKFIYEERYLDGKYQMPGKILAGQYINDGKKYEIYYFKENDTNSGYFDENGNSVQKMFLKAPVSFKYISSGFTTGQRYVEAFNVSTGHRAVDYAAIYGTPIRAVGDGTVIFASYNGAYGNMVKIRHNGTYQTNYGHMSKFAVKRGNKVKQGDIIGYVGSTGFSTGPHVHFEMEKNGIKINPLTEILPPGQAIEKNNRERFFAEIKKWQEELGK